MKKIQIKLWQLNLLASFLLITFYNSSFWHKVITIVKPAGLSEYLFVVSIFCLLVLLVNLLLTVFCWKYTYKFIYFVVFIGASMALYFVNEYNILIDSDMVQNVFETDSTEALDFVNFKLLSYVLIAGVLPLLVLLKLKVEFK